MTKQQVVQAPRPRAHGEDGRELHGGARVAARAPKPKTARGRRAHDLGRGDPRAHRARLGGVVRHARRVGRGRAIAPRDRPLGRRAAGHPSAGLERAGDHRRATSGTRGLRAVGEHADGFAVTASKTVAVPVDRLYDAFVDEPLRERWLPDGQLRERTATRPKSARFDWGDGGPTRSASRSWRRATAKSTVALEHARLADADEAERMKAFWRDRVARSRRCWSKTDDDRPTPTRSTDVLPIACPVSDQDRALEFYVGHAWVREAPRRPLPHSAARWIEVAPPGAA